MQRCALSLLVGRTCLFPVDDNDDVDDCGDENDDDDHADSAAAAVDNHDDVIVTNCYPTRRE